MVRRGISLLPPVSLLGIPPYVLTFPVLTVSHLSAKTPVPGRLISLFLTGISKGRRAQKGVFYEKLLVYMGPGSGLGTVRREVRTGCFIGN